MLNRGFWALSLLIACGPELDTLAVTLEHPEDIVHQSKDGGYFSTLLCKHEGARACEQSLLWECRELASDPGKLFWRYPAPANVATLCDGGTP